MKSLRPKSTTDESSVSNEKSIRPEARNVQVQSADIEPANAGGEEGILLDKEHTTKVHPIITNEVRNSTPSDQDLIDTSKDDSCSRPVKDMLDVRENLKVKGKPLKMFPLGRGFSTRRIKNQGSEFSLLKAQFTTFKAVVKQRLGEHDIHLLWGK